MATIPFALSISHFVNSVGADAGFAAIIGLAILVLLYFAQARETATLRQHAAEASERIRQLETRIGHLLRAQSQAPAPAQALRQTPAPVRTAAAVPAAVGAAASARVPAGIGTAVPRVAPAGVAAPALTAATKLIPTDAPGSATALAEPPPPMPAEPNHTSAATAAGANGYAHPRPGGAQRIPAPVGAGQSPPRVQIRPGAAPAAGRRGAPPPRGLEPDDDVAPPLGRRIVYGAAALVVLAAIVVGLVSLTGGSTPGHTTASRTTNAPTATKRHHGKTATVLPSTVTVAVLNGTATANMAATVSARLGAVGFKPGNIANALDQTHTATVVQYLPGHKAAALAVAKSLKLNNSAVSAIDPTALTSTSACQAPPGTTATVVPGACYANVVVTVGADLAGGSTTTPTGASGTSTGASAGAAGTATGAQTTTAP